TFGCTERDDRFGSKCEELKVSTTSQLCPRKPTQERTSVDFAFGPRADINRCTNRHRTAETFGQILSWLLETVRLRSASELAVGARAEKLAAAHHQPPCGTGSLGSLAEAFTCPVSSSSR